MADSSVNLKTSERAVVSNRIHVTADSFLMAGVREGWLKSSLFWRGRRGDASAVFMSRLRQRLILARRRTRRSANDNKREQK